MIKPKFIAISLSGCVAGALIHLALAANQPPTQQFTTTQDKNKAPSSFESIQSQINKEFEIDWDNLSLVGVNSNEFDISPDRGRLSEYYKNGAANFETFVSGMDQLASALSSFAEDDCESKLALFEPEWSRIKLEQMNSAREAHSAMLDASIEMDERLDVLDALRMDYANRSSQSGVKMMSYVQACYPDANQTNEFNASENSISQ